MSYKKASDVLPQSLLDAVQEYIDGTYLYIPRKADNRLSWGANTQTKEKNRARNREILAARLAGHPVDELAEKYCLSEKAIYKILKIARNS